MCLLPYHPSESKTGFWLCIVLHTYIPGRWAQERRGANFKSAWITQLELISNKGKQPRALNAEVTPQPEPEVTKVDTEKERPG